MTEEFYIGQIFEDTYPAEVSEWCNEQTDKVITIEEIEPINDVRRFQIVDITPTDEEQEKAERERINNLHVTRGDMFEALLLAKQITKAQIRAMIEQYVTDELQQALFLNRFDEALDFYRGYPVFDMLGTVIGITPTQWDNYFLKATDETTKDEAYKELLPVEETGGAE